MLPGEYPTHADWELHVSTTFPEVRLKQFIEVRGADAGGWDWISALPAVWKGVLYDEATLNQAWEMVKGWSYTDVVSLMRNVPKTALKTPFLDKNVQFYAEIVLSMAKQGLNNIDICDAQGRCEAQYLKPLFDVVQSGETQADKWLKLYHGEWQQNIDHLFREASHQ
jgi:glutamate--cysteine ligase